MLHATLRDGDFGARPDLTYPALGVKGRGLVLLRLMAAGASERAALAAGAAAADAGAGVGTMRWPDPTGMALSCLSLHPAVLRGRRRLAACVHALVAAGADPDLCDSDGRTALHVAVAAGNVAVAAALLETGADPDGRARTAEREGRDGGQGGGASHLHTRCRGVPGFGPAALRWRPVEEAARLGDAAMCHLLARHGASLCQLCIRAGGSGLEPATLVSRALQSDEGHGVAGGSADTAGWQTSLLRRGRQEAEGRALEAERRLAGVPWASPEEAAAASAHRVCSEARPADVVVGLALVRGARRHCSWAARRRLAVWRAAHRLAKRGGAAVVRAGGGRGASTQD